MTGAVVLHGLDAFEGKTVAVFLCGLDCGDFPVSGGIISVPYGSDANGFLDETLLNQVSALGRNWGLNQVLMDGHWNVPCVVGFRYKSRGQLLRPVANADTGAQLGPGFGKHKHLHSAAVQCYSTAGLYWGTDFSRVHKVNFTTNAGDRSLSPTELFSGIHHEDIDDEMQYDGMLCWEVRGPYSCTITAIGGFIETQDRV